ncbi:HGxxPAAW family protein [Streptomyces sp. NPDC092369]|uniref:HGxxPAAW family protein n=1 Tax=Streptomyces sp. NPDC092369 TaxID=3366015 RepID=UPI003822788D
MSAHQYDEGHTAAGWTGFGIAAVGTAVLGLGVCATSVALLAGGLGIVVVSVLVTWVLHLAGWGKPPGLRPREQWGWRVRDLTAREGHPGCVGCRLAGRNPGRIPGRGRGSSLRVDALPVYEPVAGESIPLSTIE